MTLIQKLYFLTLALRGSRCFKIAPAFTLDSIECEQPDNYMKLLECVSSPTTRIVYDTTTSLASREATPSTIEVLSSSHEETINELPYNRESSDLSADVELIIEYLHQEKFDETQNKSNDHQNTAQMNFIFELFLIVMCFQ